MKSARGSQKKRIGPRLMDSDRIRYKQLNPKVPGCHAYKLYEGYKRARPGLAFPIMLYRHIEAVWHLFRMENMVFSFVFLLK